jgi:hypothetical protein
MNPEMQPRPADEKFDFSDVDAEMGKKKPEAEEPEGEVIYDAGQEAQLGKSDEPSSDVKESLKQIRQDKEEAEWDEKIRAAKELDESMKELRQIEKDRQAKEASAVDMTDEAELVEEAAPPPVPEEKSETEKSLEDLKAIKAEEAEWDEKIRAARERVKSAEPMSEEEAAEREREAAEVLGPETMAEIKDEAEKIRQEEQDTKISAKLKGEKEDTGELAQDFLEQGNRESAAAEAGEDLDALRSEDKTGLVERVSKESLPKPEEVPSSMDPEWLKGLASHLQERVSDLKDTEELLLNDLKKLLGKEDWSAADVAEYAAEAHISPWKRLKLGWRRMTNRDFRESWSQYQRASNKRSRLEQLAVDVNDQLEHPDEWRADKLKESLQHLSRGVSQSGGRPPSGFVGNKG